MTSLTPDILAVVLFGSLMISVALIDFRKLLIPNELVLAGFAAGILLLGLAKSNIPWQELVSSVGAAAILIAVRSGGTFFLKKEAMGMGDIKLAGVIGLFVGFVPFLLSVWVASIAGLAYVVLSKPRPSKIPFGSFLAISSLIILVLKDQLSDLIIAWLV